MYIDTSHITRGGKTYTRHLLRESYRANGKVLHRTIANVSHCSTAEIAALRLALRYKEDLGACPRNILWQINDLYVFQEIRKIPIPSKYAGFLKMAESEITFSRL